MSLYHSLETPPIPGIGQFRPSPMPMENETLPSNEFAPPTLARIGQQEDQFITKREKPAQVFSPPPVASVSNTVFGNGGEKKEGKRLVLPRPPEDEGEEDTKRYPVEKFEYGGVVYRRGPAQGLKPLQE